MTVEEASGPKPELWPDNAEAFGVFSACATQWRTGPGGAIGLDYLAVKLVYDAYSKNPDTWPDVLESVRVMEDSALSEIRAKNGK